MEVPFMQKPIPLLDSAMNRGRKAASLYPKQKTEFYTIKGKEIAKIDASANYIEETLFRSVKAFPNFEDLEPFYKDLYECILDTNELKKNLSSISSVARLVKNIRRNYIVKLKELRFNEGVKKQSFATTKSYVGRLSSLLKGLSKQIDFYNESARILKELPSIRTKENCVILAGYPNAGKSTLLSRITESKPQIAAYPFTTKGLNVGVFKKKYVPIQIIDTPGLLDRPLLNRNKIELKAVTALQHLNGLIVFVVDPTQEIDKQKNLFLELKKLFTHHNFLVVINKIDVATENEINSSKDNFSKELILLEGKDSPALKDWLLNKENKIF
ncbi:MAG: 50S ribosome-binding GTPase [Candidatus ainarchaeum sp.]|jgi:nucleolar GTP-binding protein|nr:50S ribosome-binding GTPase [Candidatus ainarchaeum sp.]MDD3085658.1 50S ribosome-binding GTPase [Candidatus ainarchaeum sp.]MDD4128291.1 50S ribosome-binding GTPase [Candidatus ainarchaeum sp.]MDD4467814.1 50S ribosome-binding GTPase [Candidatus ainarchaeum sp.]HPM85827.1 50S ribosome-binding GTPase [archaeon]